MSIREHILHALPKQPQDELLGEYSTTAEGVAERLGMSKSYIRHIMSDMTKAGMLGYVNAYPYQDGKYRLKRLNGRCKMRCYHVRG